MHPIVRAAIFAFTISSLILLESPKVKAEPLSRLNIHSPSNRGDQEKKILEMAVSHCSMARSKLLCINAASACLEAFRLHSTLASRPACRDVQIYRRMLVIDGLGSGRIRGSGSWRRTPQPAVAQVGRVLCTPNDGEYPGGVRWLG